MDGLRRRAGRALLTLLALAASLGTAGVAEAQQAFFMGLGDLPGGDFYSSARDVSGDGSIVVGSSGDQPFRWTLQTGMVPLPGLSGQATRISADGSTILVNSTTNAGLHRSYRWTQSEGAHLISLGDIRDDGYVWDLSGDGSLFVGQRQEVSGTNQAVQWTEAGGVERIAPQLESTVGRYVSDDGRVVVGNERSAGEFIWTAEKGTTFLGLGASSFGGISPDGTTYVGGGLTRAPVRWTQQTGLEELGPLPDGVSTGYALGASEDASVIVGSGSPFLTSSGAVAWIWDEQHGRRYMESVLANDYGLAAAVANWDLRLARSISNDGRTVVGVGINPTGNTEAWIAFLGDPVAANPADFDGDGAVNGDDFLAWQRHVGLAAGATRTQGDANGDGRVDAADLALWKSHFGPASATSPAMPVPEPSAWALVGPALALFLAAARGRVSPRRESPSLRENRQPWGRFSETADPRLGETRPRGSAAPLARPGVGCMQCTNTAQPRCIACTLRTAPAQLVWRERCLESPREEHAFHAAKLQGDARARERSAGLVSKHPVHGASSRGAVSPRRYVFSVVALPVSG